MRFRNRSNRIKTGLCFLLLIFASEGHTATDPRALKCIENYVEKYSQIQKYRALLIKKEWDKDGELIHDERIALSYSKPSKISFTYLNEGSSGIRNNGMKVDYEGGTDVRIQLGKSSGLGFITNGVASALVGSRTPLYDPKVIDDEIFTINRAGFDFLTKLLIKFLPTLKNVPNGGLSLIGDSGCKVKYLPHETGEVKVTLDPEDSISVLEEKYGTLAYLIYQSNRDQFDKFHELFTRTKRLTLQVPRSFFEFDLNINAESQFPDQLSLYRNGKLIAEYQFKNLEY